MSRGRSHTACRTSLALSEFARTIDLVEFAELGDVVVFGAAQIGGRELGLGHGVRVRLAYRQGMNRGSPRMHTGVPMIRGLAALQLELAGGAGVPGGAVVEAPALVDHASNLMTRDVSSPPVRLVALRASTERLTKPLGVTKHVQQLCSSSFISKV